MNEFILPEFHDLYEAEYYCAQQTQQYSPLHTRRSQSNPESCCTSSQLEKATPVSRIGADEPDVLFALRCDDVSRIAYKKNFHAWVELCELSAYTG